MSKRTEYMRLRRNVIEDTLQLEDEEWLTIETKRSRADWYKAISNRGRYMRQDGSIGVLPIERKITNNGVKELVSHIIASHFLITVKRPDQTWIDHITHHPVGMYPNDVRNLRWCTVAENNTFEEALNNRNKGIHTPECLRKMSDAKKGKVPWSKGKKLPQISGPNHYNWNPDKEGMHKRRLEYKAKRRAAKRKAKQLSR